MPGGATREKPLILVVDDDPMERYLHRQALEPAGFEVVEAKNGLMAPAVFAAAQPDLVVLDVVMPGMHGFDVCEAIRRMPAGRDTPILMATGLDDVASIDRAYRVGATDFFGKPINWAVLPYRVRYLLRAARNFAELAESERGLAEAQRIAGLGNFRWSPNSASIDASMGLSRIFGFAGDRDTLSARSLLRRIPADDRAKVFAAVRKAFDGEKIDLDHRVVAPDGVSRTVSLRAEVAAAPGGRSCLRGTYQDITERKRIETELEIARDEAVTASAAKTAFLAAMSHELRTPLNAIIGFSGLIAEEASGPAAQPRYAEFAGYIQKAGRRVLDVFLNVLTMAQLEAGRYRLELERVDLDEIVETALAEFRLSELGRGRDVVFEKGADQLTVRADGRAVVQMLSKLLSNAAKFSAAGTVIRLILARAQDGRARVSIADEGIGMCAQEVDLAVVPFGQVDGRVARRYEGLGLGLSIVNRLIERHGGRLTITSRPQQGTCVSLDFPIEADDGDAAVRAGALASA